MCVLTGCLQAEIFSDLVVVTWMSEVKDAVTGEVHLENIKTHNVTNKTQYWNIFIQTHTGPVNVFGCFIIIYDNIQLFLLFIQ